MPMVDTQLVLDSQAFIAQQASAHRAAYVARWRAAQRLSTPSKPPLPRLTVGERGRPVSVRVRVCVLSRTLSTETPAGLPLSLVVGSGASSGGQGAWLARAKPSHGCPAGQALCPRTLACTPSSAWSAASSRAWIGLRSASFATRSTMSRRGGATTFRRALSCFGARRRCPLFHSPLSTTHTAVRAEHLFREHVNSLCFLCHTRRS